MKSLLAPAEVDVIVSFTLIVTVLCVLLGRLAVEIGVLLNNCVLNPGLVAIAVGDDILVVILAVVGVSNVVVVVPFNELLDVNSALEVADVSVHVVNSCWVETAAVPANVDFDDVELSM